jgi:hypothetical protein
MRGKWLLPARIRALDIFTVAQVVKVVDPINKDDSWLCIFICAT